MTKFTRIQTIVVKDRKTIRRLARAAEEHQKLLNVFRTLALELHKHKQLMWFNERNIEKWVRNLTTTPINTENLQAQGYKLFQIVGADATKALVRRVVKEVHSVKIKWRNGEYANLPKPIKISKLNSFTFETNHNMRIDERSYSRKRTRNRFRIRLIKGLSVEVPVNPELEVSGMKIVWNKDLPAIVIYSHEVKQRPLQLNPDNWMSLDFGINNLVTAVSNVLPQAIIFNGRPVKSLIQWVAKTVSKLQEKEDNTGIRRVFSYYKRRINHLLHDLANRIIDLAIQNNIGTIIGSNSLGTIYQQKRKGKNSKKNNQTLSLLPLMRLWRYIKEKAKLYGIKVIEVDETHTSSYSALGGTAKRPNGTRRHRGLFVDSRYNVALNADANAALNIARRAGIKISNYTIWIDKLARPMKYSPSPAGWAHRIGDSLTLLHSRAGPPTMIANNY